MSAMYDPQNLVAALQQNTFGNALQPRPAVNSMPTVQFFGPAAPPSMPNLPAPLSPLQLTSPSGGGGGYGGSAGGGNFLSGLMNIGKAASNLFPALAGSAGVGAGIGGIGGAGSADLADALMMFA